MRSIAAASIAVLSAILCSASVRCEEAREEVVNPPVSLRATVELLRKHPLPTPPRVSKCIVITPQPRESGVALCRTPDGVWSYPSFVKVAIEEVDTPFLIEVKDKALAENLKKGEVEIRTEDGAKATVSTLKGDSWDSTQNRAVKIEKDLEEQIKLYGESSEYQALLSKAGEEGEDEMIAELLSLVSRKG